jgi:hypothetical protein
VSAALWIPLRRRRTFACLAFVRVSAFRSARPEEAPPGTRSFLPVFTFARRRAARAEGSVPPPLDCRDFCSGFRLGLRCSRRCAAGSVSVHERARVGFSPAAPPVLLLPLAGFPLFGRSCCLLRIPASPSIDSGESDGARLDFTAASRVYRRYSFFGSSELGLAPPPARFRPYGGACAPPRFRVP